MKKAQSCHLAAIHRLRITDDFLRKNLQDQVRYKHQFISSIDVDLFSNWPRTHFVNLSAVILQTMGFVKFFSPKLSCILKVTGLTLI